MSLKETARWLVPAAGMVMVIVGAVITKPEISGPIFIIGGGIIMVLGLYVID